MIHLFIIAYNEEDIISHTINYYAPHVAGITLYDNESTDNTVSKALSAFPAIEVIRFGTSKKFNDGKHVEIRNSCWQNKIWQPSDWAIIIDADEWLMHRQRQPLLNALNDADCLNNYHGIKCLGVQAVAEKINYEDELLPQTKLYHDSSYQKAIAFRPFFYAKTNFTNGGHNFYPEISDQAFNNIGVNKLNRMRISEREFAVVHLKYIHRKKLIKKHTDYFARLSRYNLAHRCGMEYGLGKEYVDKKYLQFSGLIPYASMADMAYIPNY